MKNFIEKLPKLFTHLALTISFLSLISCQEQRETNPDKNTTSVVASKVKPPKMDIHTAVLSGDLQALLQHIQAGTNLNEKDPFGGSSPLITAAVFNKPQEAKLLIEAGAAVNFKNKDGATALHMAAFLCRPEIVKMLLKAGADKTIKNNYGATAYDSVTTSFSETKNIYLMLEKVLGPMGLKLDYAYLEKTRPQIAALLQ